MATAKFKRKPRLSKIESYKAANIKEVLCRCSWAHTRLLLLVVLGEHADSTGCLDARKCQGLGSLRIEKVRKVELELELSPISPG